MSNASFTRDEVILALDVLYFSGEKSLTKNSVAIKELSEILQELPIHPKESRSVNFRNTVGVSDQLIKFRSEREGRTSNTWKVGSLFHTVADDFEQELEELHSIASAIKRNNWFFKGYYSPYQIFPEFREGQLLTWLHYRIETREQKKGIQNRRCSLCQIRLDDIYNVGHQFLQKHLLVPPSKLLADKQYSKDDFIEVCPTCHTALHLYRPWRTLENAADIFR